MQLFCFRNDAFINPRRHQDPGNKDTPGLQSAGQFNSRQTRHVVVDHHGMDRLSPHQLHRLFTVLCFQSVKSTALQSLRQRLTKVAIVVGDQQRRMMFRHSLRSLDESISRPQRKKGSLQCEINYYKIAYNGTNNNSLAFDMLEGLNAGNNMTWSLSVQRTIAKNLQLNINYNGRKPEDIPTIHAGGLQLRAFF